MEKLEVLGVDFHPVNLKEALNKIDEFIKEKTPHLIVTLGTEMTVMARKDYELRDIINKSHLVVPDTAGIVWSAKVLHKRKIKKVAGVDLLENLIREGSEKGYTFYFLGAKEGVAKKAAENLKIKYPPVKILGTHHGYFKDKEEELINEIKNLKPDILIVALGVPFQEKWSHKNLEKLNVPVSMGVGGSFDVFSGNIKRAPQWMINLNLEWLYRLWKEPSRFGRMLVLPYFMLLVIKERFFG